MAATSIDATLAAAIDADTTTEEILLAATNHDLDALRKLFQTNDAKVQDADTGYSPLHAAIAACEPDDELKSDPAVNGEGDALNGEALGEESALATVKLLFQNGAIWNELDKNDETPGCLALRMGLNMVYDAIVDAGVRAELLFNMLDDYEPLPDEPDEEAEEPDDDAIIGFEPAPERQEQPLPRNPNGTQEEFAGFEPSPNPLYKIEEDSEFGARARAAAHGVQPVNAATTEAQTAEQTQDQAHSTEPVLTNPNVNSADYLQSNLTYSGDRLLDSDKNAVMMDWETEIMKTSADKLCPKQELRTMNVGFGMGIVDSMFLENSPTEHHIVEAHPQVLARMREKGWFEKPNVRIHQGKWQDVLPKLVEEGVVLDAMYYDTYAEDYKDLKQFFDEYVIALLDSNGLFGFYNGLGADRQVCYDVYTKVVELHLDEAGLDVEWVDIDVPDLAGRGEWEGVRRPYWANIKTYRLPTCKFVG
ncbi:Arginine N-methyltransferase 2 [Vermiconidia calcicola]|uniref:Arginine N-methyltransferase 2 n=1 Tax=Vermiconidia calcicola TaxID=1690605 RepID=A0ACC3NWB0_9PEZI|nr:Arginine N-methyltransferase 2 [Vermiconidia calcicola]